MMMKVGKLPEDFMEGMSCEGGCVNGPGSVLTGRIAAANRQKLLSTVDDRNIYDTVNTYSKYDIHMHH